MENAIRFVENTGCLVWEKGVRAFRTCQEESRSNVGQSLAPAMFNKWLGKVFDGPCHPKGKLGSGCDYEIAFTHCRAAGQLVVHPLLAETCIQRKTMYLSAALIGNEFRVHLTLLRKHFTVRVSEFMLIPPWMTANAMLKSKTSESELVKNRVFNLNDYKP